VPYAPTPYAFMMPYALVPYTETPALFFDSYGEPACRGVAESEAGSIIFDDTPSKKS